jgi:HemY protein
MLAAPPPKRIEAESKALAEPSRDDVVVPIAPTAQDNAPAAAAPAEPVPPPAAETAPAPAAKPEPVPVQPAPLFRTRQDIPKAPPQAIPQVIPIVRAPDDPGIDDEAQADEFSEQIGTPKAQVGGWRGFLSRWGS